MERQSRSTFGNAVETARLLRPLGASTLLLITDRFHMPRARLAFAVAGVDIVGALGPSGALRPLARRLVMVIRQP